MLNDITLGQHFPGNSIVHRLDPRMKIILVILYIVAIFMLNTLTALLIPVVYAVVGYALSKIPIKVALKGLKPMIPVIIFASLFNIFFISGEVIFQWQFVQITKEGLLFAAIMVTRIICLIVGTSLLTYTTSPIELTDAIEGLLRPLEKIKAPIHELAMMMSIALRFIPTLIEETQKIISAQKARGADFESGSLFDRIRALIPILIPLFVSSFRRAMDLALAMECRCYHGGKGRTKLKQLKYGRLDLMMLLFTLFIFVGAYFFNRYVGAFLI